MPVKFSAALRVLVVGDEDLFRWAVRETLEGAGHLVKEASASVETVRTAIRIGAPDVVVFGPAMELDQQIALLRECQRSTDAGLVVISGEGSRESKFDLLRAGATRVADDTVDVADVPALVADANRCRPI